MAETFGLPVGVVEESVSWGELLEWCEFWRYKHEEQSEAIKRAQEEAKRGR